MNPRANKSNRRPFIKEGTLQKLWHEEFLRGRTLHTEDGSEVRIISPGRWNKSRGPDFLKAKILYDGDEVMCDVEIDLHPKDWIRHKHNENPDYNDVFLLITLFGDNAEKALTSANDRVVRISLMKSLSKSEIEIIKKYALGLLELNPCWEPIICERKRGRITPHEAKIRLEDLGRERIDGKIKRASKRIRDAGYEQAIYEGLLESSGYSQNRHQMLVLANVLPLRILHNLLKYYSEEKRGFAAEAILLGICRLLPHQNKSGHLELDMESKVHFQRIESIWRKTRYDLNPFMLPDGFFRFGNQRPTSSPTRTLAGLACFLSTYVEKNLFDLLGSCFSKKSTSTHRIVQQVKTILNPKTPHYWSYRFGFSSRASKPYLFFGNERIKRFIGNILVPIYYHHAASNNNQAVMEQITAFIKNLKVPPNRITAFVSDNLPLNSGERKNLSFLMEQGMIRLYECFCDPQKCQDCILNHK